MCSQEESHKELTQLRYAFNGLLRLSAASAYAVVLELWLSDQALLKIVSI